MYDILMWKVLFVTYISFLVIASIQILPYNILLIKYVRETAIPQTAESQCSHNIEERLTITIAVANAIALISITPYIIVTMMYLIHSLLGEHHLSDENSQFKLASRIAMLLYLSNSFLNSLAYLTRTKKFRNFYLRKINSIWKLSLKKHRRTSDVMCNLHDSEAYQSTIVRNKLLSEEF